MSFLYDIFITCCRQCCHIHEVTTEINLFRSFSSTRHFILRAELAKNAFEPRRDRSKRFFMNLVKYFPDYDVAWIWCPKRRFWKTSQKHIKLMSVTHAERIVVVAAASNHERRSTRVLDIALNLMKAGERVTIHVPIEVVENLLAKTCSLAERYASGGAGGRGFSGELLQRVFICAKIGVGTTFVIAWRLSKFDYLLLDIDMCFSSDVWQTHSFDS